MEESNKIKEYLDFNWCRQAAKQITQVANRNLQVIDKNLDTILKTLDAVEQIQIKIVRNFDVIKKKILDSMETYISSLETEQNAFVVLARVGRFFKSLNSHFQALFQDFATGSAINQKARENLEASRRDFEIVRQGWRNALRRVDVGLVTECDEKFAEFLKTAIQSAMETNQAQYAKLYREQRDFEYVVKLSTSLARKISDVLELVQQVENLNIQL